MQAPTLPWFPPAPAPGPASVLQLSPDEWAMEPKIDGIRVIWFDGKVYTRHGSPLTASKGAGRLTQVLADIPHTLDGEWVPALETYFVFDLPDCMLDYVGRRAALNELLAVEEANIVALAVATNYPHVRLVTNFHTGNLAEYYAYWKLQGAEGVVLKRRRAIYTKQLCSGVECRDWLKRRFLWG